MNLLHKILRWSERYTKTDMVYLAHGGFWTILSYIILVGAGVATTIALANFLPKEVYGTYQFILALAGIVSVMTLSGMQTAIVKAVAQGNDGALRSGVREKFKWNIGIVLASGAVSIYYFINDNNQLGTAFLIVGAFVPLIEGFKLSHSFLIGKEAFRDTVMLGAWRKPLPLLALLATVYLTDNLLILVFVYFASNAFTYTLLYYLTIRKYQPPRTEDTEMVNYSKHLSVLKIAGVVANNIDKVLVWHLLGAASVASLIVAQLATRYSGGVFNSLKLQFLPRVSKRDLPTLQKTLPRKVWIFTAIMIVFATFYVVAVPFVFPLLFPTYSESIMLAQLLAVSLLLLPRNAYFQTLVAHKQVKAQYIIGIGVPVVKMILLYVLIPLYGIWGAVYAIVTSDIFSSILTTYFFATARPLPEKSNDS